jgi:hypothetical protein
MWVNSDANSVVAQVTSSGGVASFNFSSETGGLDFVDIISAPDGNLWALYYYSPGSFNVFDTSGTYIATYPVGYYPTAMASDETDVWAVGVGPDFENNLWKITSGGAVTPYSLVGAGRLYDICLGPDGNMWASDGDGGVWSIDTSTGAGTFYALTGSSPTGICTDGTDLWLTDNGVTTPGVWRVTTSGVGTNYPGVAMVSILFDGTDLWTTDGDTSIYQVTTAGVIGSAVTVTDGTIAASSLQGGCYFDGNVWWTGRGGDGNAHVWKYTAPGPAPANQIVMIL